MSKIILCLILWWPIQSFGQIQHDKTTTSVKGNWYVYWGWNWEDYSKSDITFTGPDYHFTLKRVIARDSPSDFAFEKYFGIRRFTIPQFNFRIGHILSPHWDISFGMDHMKYVVVQDQTVSIKGSIAQSQSSYDGNYNGEQITLTEDFLTFEHTDGLNYENIELRWSDILVHTGQLNIHVLGGLGMGILLPKTNTLLFARPRHDDYHLSGYGISSVIGLNALFFGRFFIQSEMKAGFIHMPDIRTSFDSSDRARQHFLFYQRNVVFGARFQLGPKTKAQGAAPPM